MERLTERELNVLGCASYTKCNTDECVGYCGGCNAEEEAKLKLKRYEDLEEQGLLITLPCKVGDTVWTLKYPEITKEDGSVWTVCDRKKQTVVPVKFTLFILKDIGVYYFLTKEEAEAKLKEFQSK